MEKSLLTAFLCLSFGLPSNIQATSIRPRTVRDSIKVKRLQTVKDYEQQLALLVKTHRVAEDDSLALPCPYYYKLFGNPVLYDEPLRNEMQLDWNGQAAMCTDELPALQTVDDKTLALNDNINKALVWAYLNHPELIQETQDELMSETSIRPDVSSLVKQDVKLTEIATVPDDSVPVVDSVGVVPQKPNFWTFKGDYSLQLTQAYYSDNWYKGGESYNALLGSTTLQYNYNNKEKVKWDNMLELRLGFQSSKSDTEHKYKTNSDLIRLTSKLGLQASKHWYYTFQTLAYTQFYPGYKSNDAKVYSDFLSPFNLVLSLGMDYKYSKNKFNSTVTLSPISYNFRYVDRIALAPDYGLKARHRTYSHFGPSILANATWEITSYLKWTSRFYWFTDLSSNDFEWENTFDFKIGKFLSTKLFLYPRIDDSARSYKSENGNYFMFQELFSLGFSYSM